MISTGSDPNAMRRLATSMDQEADVLEAQLRRLVNEASAVGWQGDDANGFRTRLSDTHSRSITVTANELRQAARDLRSQARQQEQASR